MRVLIVEDEPYLAEAVRDGLRLEAIAADIAGDGDTALELLSVNSYDLAVLDRDVPGPSGDDIARWIVASGSGIPILMLTAADRLEAPGQRATRPPVAQAVVADESLRISRLAPARQVSRARHQHRTGLAEEPGHVGIGRGGGVADGQIKPFGSQAGQTVG